MDQRWEIIYYETSQGKSPVFEFIQDLGVNAQNKVVETLEQLEKFGTLLGHPHSRKVVSTPLWELRILGGDNIRIFYVAIINRRFLLLHAFAKKKQKTDTREIKTAKNRLEEYKLRLKTAT